MNPTKLTLYGTPPTRALRPLWLLNELGLVFDFVEIDVRSGEQFAPAFTAINKAAKIPVLVDGTFTIIESAAISLYLAERYGSGRFIPEDTLEYTQMLQWMFFLATEIEQPLWRISLHRFGYAEHERSTSEIELAKRDCRRMLTALESHMESREFLVGDSLSVADFFAAYTLDWADAEKLLDGSASLAAFLELMYARPLAPPRIMEALAVKSAELPQRFRAQADFRLDGAS